MYANSAIVAKVLMINGVNTLVFKKQVFSVYLVGEMVRMAHTIFLFYINKYGQNN